MISQDWKTVGRACAEQQLECGLSCELAYFHQRNFGEGHPKRPDTAHRRLPQFESRRCIQLTFRSIFKIMFFPLTPAVSMSCALILPTCPGPNCLPGDSYVVMFWAMTYLVIRDFDVPPRKELHRSLQVPSQWVHAALLCILGS